MNAALLLPAPIRDPRFQPAIGDELRRVMASGRESIRRVMRVQFSEFAGKTYVTYRTTTCGHGKADIDAWRRWAAGADVTFIAGEGSQ